MTYLQLVNHHGGTVEKIETPLTLREFISIHWGAWGFYKVMKAGPNMYMIFDSFSNKHCYTIGKIKKGDMQND